MNAMIRMGPRQWPLVCRVWDSLWKAVATAGFSTPLRIRQTDRPRSTCRHLGGAGTGSVTLTGSDRFVRALICGTTAAADGPLDLPDT